MRGVVSLEWCTCKHPNEPGLKLFHSLKFVANLRNIVDESQKRGQRERRDKDCDEAELKQKKLSRGGGELELKYTFMKSSLQHLTTNSRSCTECIEKLVM